jgi:hypothetical protein
MRSIFLNRREFAFLLRTGGDGVALTRDLSYGVGVGVGVSARVLCAADSVCLTAEIPRT